MTEIGRRKLKGQHYPNSPARGTQGSRSLSRASDRQALWYRRERARKEEEARRWGWERTSPGVGSSPIPKGSMAAAGPIHSNAEAKGQERHGLVTEHCSSQQEPSRTRARTRTHTRTRAHAYMLTHARICTHTRICMHTHACMHTRTRAQAYMRTHAHMRICTHTHTRAHTRTHTCTRTRTHMRTRTHTHMCTRKTFLRFFRGAMDPSADAPTPPALS